MFNKIALLGAVGILLLLQTGCLGYVWTGASLLYDRHDVYKKLSDYNLNAQAVRLLYRDKLFKDSAMDLAVFNGDILLAGQVRSLALRNEAERRITSIQGFRRFFNQLAINSKKANLLQDSWITAQIRGKIFSDSFIDPDRFKIVTSDKIVYLMGDVEKEQAEKVIKIARNIRGVKRVVNLLRIFSVSP